jgi:hypothetical protein
MDRPVTRLLQTPIIILSHIHLMIRRLFQGVTRRALELTGKWRFPQTLAMYVFLPSQMVHYRHVFCHIRSMISTLETPKFLDLRTCTPPAINNQHSIIPVILLAGGQDGERPYATQATRVPTGDIYPDLHPKITIVYTHPRARAMVLPLVHPTRSMHHRRIKALGVLSPSLAQTHLLDRIVHLPPLLLPPSILATRLTHMRMPVLTYANN